MKTACVIAIGDELLNGFTVDSNTQWIKEQLLKTNVSVTKSIIIPDSEASILKELDYSISASYDFIIITGGLGPTHDDITKLSLSNFFKSPLNIDQNHLTKTKKRFQSLYKKIIKILVMIKKILMTLSPHNQCL